MSALDSDLSINVDAVDRYLREAIRLNVKKFMSDNDLTQRRMADVSRLSTTAVSHTMNREHGGLPGLHTVVMLSLAMGVTLDELCGLGELRARISEEVSGGIYDEPQLAGD